MEQLLPIIIGLLSGAVGGNIAGSLLKSGMGTLGRSITGIVGGAGLAWVLQIIGGGGASVAEATNTATTSGLNVVSILKTVIGGGVGGGILTAILGMVMGKK